MRKMKQRNQGVWLTAIVNNHATFDKFFKRSLKNVVFLTVLIVALMTCLFYSSGVAQTSLPLPLLINSAGGQYRASDGSQWQADTYFMGGNTYISSNTIAGTKYTPLYQSERYGNGFDYQIPLANGKYRVTLYFAEMAWKSPGKRIFSVSAQGERILNNFDIFAVAGGANKAVSRSFSVTVTNGVLNIRFQASVDNASIAAIKVALASTYMTQSPAPSFTQQQYMAAVNFDFGGENGILPSNPTAPSLGYPCGVPNQYSWKYGIGGAKDVAAAIGGRGSQLAAAAYNQIYNGCLGANSRKSMPNARIEFSTMTVDYFSTRQNQWIRAVQSQPTTGAAFAEDFVNNQATGADYVPKFDGSGYATVRSGIGNAAGDAGSSTGRVVQDGAVGYNFHGFTNRFNIDWADVTAIVLSQSMRCVPNSGTDLGDCNKMGYIADVGLDSWATTSSPFDGFKTHGGVGAGRFKPVTTSWQVFTNYNGPASLLVQAPPPVPKF